MGVAKSSFLFAMGTFLSRLSGLLRDIIVAGVFGATNLLDAFWVANRIPNLFREMLAEGALGSSFTKVYTQLCETDRAKADQLLVNALWLGLFLTMLVCGLGIIFAPQFVYLFTFMAKESRGEEFVRQTVGLTRLLFPFLGIASLAAIVSGVMYQRGRFFLSASTSISLNIGYIVGALALAPFLLFWNQPWIEKYIADPRITGLALGVLLGGAGQFLIQFIVVVRDVFWRRPLSWRWQRPIFSPEVKRILIIMGPASIAASTPLINLIINTNFATRLEEGAVSYLNYAFRLLHFPVAIFGVAVGAVALPSLTKALTRAKGRVGEEVNSELQSSLDLVFWLMLPCCLFLLKDSLPLSQLIFRHGRYDDIATLKTAECLFAYSLSVVPYGLIKVLSAFYFAVERTKYAMKISLIAIAINFLANYFLVEQFRHMGLAAASSCTVTFNAVFLAIGLRFSGVKFNARQVWKSLKYLSLGAALFYLLGWALKVMFTELGYGETIYGQTPWANLLQVVVDGLLLMLIYFRLALYRMDWSLKHAVGILKKIRH